MYARANLIVTIIISLQLIGAAVLSTVYQTYLATALIGGAAAVMFFATRHLCPGTFLQRSAAGLALQTLATLAVYQLHGQEDAHLLFFTTMTVMMVYEDWLCPLPGVVLVVVGHAAFALMQNSGLPVRFFDDAIADAGHKPLPNRLAVGMIFLPKGLVPTLASKLGKGE